MPSGGQADLNLRLLHNFARYLEDTHGREALKQICAEADVDWEHLDGRAHWVTVAQFQALLAKAREWMADDREFMTACTYRFGSEAYGVLRFAMMALSPRQVYEYGAKCHHMISSISKIENTWHTSTHFLCRYTSKHPEIRLMCLSRQAHTANFPTLWGLPPAYLKEGRCISRGDDCCEYDVRIHQHRRDLPVVIGAFAGVLIGILFTVYDLAIPMMGTMGILGAVIGYALELRRTNRVNLTFGQELHNAFADIAREDADARRELFELNQRQREWTRIMEGRLAERSAALETVVERAGEMNRVRQTTLRGVSHDLRNPLTWLSVETDFLRQYLADDGPQAQDLLENHEQAVERMKRLLEELIDVAVSDNSMIPLEGKTLEVTPLPERLRKRLNALVRARDVKVSVFANREVPETIVTDALVFDRVVDNLLTNAAKYTTRGSIVVELDGTPSFLTIKVSDTGCGIKQEEINKIFEARRRPVSRGDFISYGLGLSVVVQLLDQVGGKLEVMSIEGKGSTFWAHFPTVMKSEDGPPRRADEAIARVVTIRRAAHQ
jgi:signal transduction histidine kinase